VTALEAYARAEICARLASLEPDPVKRTALEHMRELWTNLANEARDGEEDITVQFEMLLDVHAGLYRHLGINPLQ
jgi:hypothetical protein